MVDGGAYSPNTENGAYPVLAKSDILETEPVVGPSA
jgi:hypothetical protein